MSRRSPSARQWWCAWATTIRMFATIKRSARTGALVFTYSSAQRCSSSRDIGTQRRRSKWFVEVTRMGVA
jgi:hypothetical protein